jgi:hypothetical protein
VPNIGNQAEAIAGSSAAIFTSTDRKLIEEISGGINKTRTFREIFGKKPLTREVENEETPVKVEQNVKEIEGRYQEHKSMLKNAAAKAPKEQVSINSSPDENSDTILPANNQPQTAPSISNKKEDGGFHPEAAAIVKELKLNPAELFDKLSLEQNELINLIYRIKEIHLKRLLSETQKEFEALSEEITNATLSASRPEARAWLKEQLDKLTLDSAKYKRRLLKSLQSLEFDKQREENIKWLEKVVARYS